jgi:hypothetical protein
MKTPLSNHTIVEQLLIGLILIVAAALTYVGGTIFEHLGESTASGRLLALPMLDISLVMGHDYTPGTVRAAVYIGGYLIYFFAGLLLLSLAQDWYKKNGGKKSGGPRII